MLEGDDRERALEVLGRCVTDMADIGGDGPCGGDTCRGLLAALEREFVLVRPGVNTDENSVFFGECICNLCNCDYEQGHSCNAGLGGSKGPGAESPGPNCPAHREAKP